MVKRVLLFAVVSFMVLGCSNDYGPGSAIETRSGPPYWDFCEPGFLRGSDRLELSNVSFVVAGPKSVRVSGKARLVYTEGDWEKCWRDDPVVGNRWGQNGRPDRGIRFTNQRIVERSPKGLTVNMLGSSYYVNIDSDGTFSETITLRGSIVLEHKLVSNSKYTRLTRMDNRGTATVITVKNDAPRKYVEYGTYNSAKWYYDQQFGVNPTSPSCPGRSSYSKEFDFSPQVCTLKKDVNGATDFAFAWVKKHLCLVTLNTQEQVTGRPVSATITITPTNAPTYESRVGLFKRALEAEFDGDTELVEAGMSAVKSHLDVALDTPRSDKTQSTSFIAWTGTTYKLDAINGEYDTISGFVTPESSADITKTILLLQK